jgi:hypothetical protein
MEALIKIFDISTIDILKIDIEGAEGELFRDRQVALAFLSKVKALGIEIHEDLVDRSVVENTLKEANFEFFLEGESIFAFNKNFPTVK